MSSRLNSLEDTVMALREARENAKSFAQERLWCCQDCRQHWVQCDRCVARQAHNAGWWAQIAAHHAQTLAAIMDDNPVYIMSRWNSRP